MTTILNTKQEVSTRSLTCYSVAMSYAPSKQSQHHSLIVSLKLTVYAFILRPSFLHFNKVYQPRSIFTLINNRLYYYKDRVFVPPSFERHTKCFKNFILLSKQGTRATSALIVACLGIFSG